MRFVQERTETDPGRPIKATALCAGTGMCICAAASACNVTMLLYMSSCAGRPGCVTKTTKLMLHTGFRIHLDSFLYTRCPGEGDHPYH
jgi:hypothetical protein